MNATYLFTALIWSSIGLGFFIYGKKQHSPAPLAAGIILMVASYFAGTTLSLSIVGIGIILGLYALKRMT